jgi:hypothetical protein
MHAFNIHLPPVGFSGVLYADLVVTDQTPHNPPDGWFGPAQYFLSLFLYFSGFSFSFSVISFYFF